MSDILKAVRLKDKLTIAGTMAAIAVVLAVVVGLLTFFTADRHTHIYDYSLKLEEDGSFTLVGLCNVDNCENPYYIEENLQGVELISAISPTCAKEGYKKYSYTYNGITVEYRETLPKAAHMYDYELVTKDESVHINGKCKTKDCPDPYVFVYDAQDLTLIEVVEATCFSPRKETYAFISGGETKTFETLVAVNVPHTLQGSPVTSLQNPDKTYNYGTEGIKLLGATTLACGTVGEGYYVCEICRQAVGVRVRQVEHDFVYSESELVPPTLEADGHAIVRCMNDGCEDIIDITLNKVEKDVNAFTKTPATELQREVITYVYESDEYGFKVELDFEIGELLTHEYVYQLRPQKANPDKMDLVGICSQPDCQTPEIRKEDVECTFEDTSTCTEKGFWIWTHIMENGQKVVLEVKSVAFASHSYDCDKNAIDAPTVNDEGKAVLFCTANGCSHSVKVTLPKVVIGENATLYYETDAFISYEYKYETEYDYTVTTYIIIMK